MGWLAGLPQGVLEGEGANWLADVTDPHSLVDQPVGTAGGRLDGRKPEEGSCMVETWRCLSGVMEEGVRHMERPGGLQRSVVGTEWTMVIFNLVTTTFFVFLCPLLYGY